MVLRDAAGNVVDGLNYGGHVDPWAGEGYQAISGAGESGCFVTAPGMGGGGGGGRQGFGPSASQPNRSAGRYPDGTDTDSNCRDFLLQNGITMIAPSAAGSNNVKVASVANLVNGQKVIIGSGTDSETAIIAAIGTTGATTVGTATTAGATVIPVANVNGFVAGQSITIDNGANSETAVIVSVTAGRQNFGGGNNNPNAPAPTPSTITVTRPLTKAHASGVQVSGSGITFASPLTKAHESGSQVASNLPTPGEPNQFRKL
jgi:non-reducing end alpha-L-arabinofuranosidase